MSHVATHRETGRKFQVWEITTGGVVLIDSQTRERVEITVEEFRTLYTVSKT